jgi:N4-(beta-N-acetylglucosaminyl)-L-asparaginase
LPASSRKKLTRRDFVKTTTVAMAAGRAASLHAQAPAVVTGSVKPVVIASANGHRFRNGGKQTAIETAFAMMTGGTDVLESLIAGVNIVELDPEDTSVGYGGLPNADGVVQLDSCCMHGPKRRAGGVASLEGVRTPSKVW